MTDHDVLRDTLQRLTPEPETPIDVEAVRRGARRRRTRQSAVGIAAGCLVALAGYAVLSSGVVPQGAPAEPADDPTHSITPSPDGWRRIAPSPLTPRNGALGAWTGTELIVAGGSKRLACPPYANCVRKPDTSSDAAAYDPATDTWRRLPSAPAPVWGGRAVWTGDEVVFVSPFSTLAFDPADESWRLLDGVPLRSTLQPLVVADGDVIAVAYQQHESIETTDWRLDLDTGDWSALPHDPFGESVDRSMGWDGERLWLLSTGVEAHLASAGGDVASRVAVLEDGHWRVVEDETPAMGQGQMWWITDGSLVAPAVRYTHVVDYPAPSRVFDIGSGTWRKAPAIDTDPDCPMPPAGVGKAWVSGGGSVLVSSDPLATTAVPPCPGLADPDVAVWADGHLVVWGGPTSDYSANSGTGLLWTPPAPEAAARSVG